MTADTVTVTAVHALRLTTVLRTDAAPARPTTSPLEVITQVDVVHDMASVLEQSASQDDFTPEAAVAWCRDRLDALTPVRGRVLGRTAVLFARVPEADRAAAARALFAAWAGGKPGAVRGGELVPGVALYSATDPGLLVLLCDPGDDAERAAAARLYGPLRLAEAFAHKVAAQQAEYEDLRGKLFDARNGLDAELAPYTRAVTAAGPSVSEAADRVLAANHRVTTAYVNLCRVVARARRMAAMLCANRANLRTYLAAVGDGPGRRAVAGRVRAAGLAVGQVRTDLAAVRPLLDVAEWTSTYHCHRQLTALALAEAKANRLREAEEKQRERVDLLLAAAAAWLGFTQVWEAVVAAQPEEVRGTGWWTMGVLMFVPALLAGPVIWLLVWGGWSLAERARARRTPHPRHRGPAVGYKEQRSESNTRVRQLQGSGR
jgi:hypothetical protein